jgi:predicted MFS family arabinose efflux permease
MTETKPPRSETAVILIIAAVQFVNILDFLMVSPLAKDLAGPLHFDESRIGIVTGSYTAAAAVAGFAGSFFLDRFDRRVALAVALLGLACGTAACGLAHDLHELMAARVIAGAFGGPATSIALAVIADQVPAERRGRAMGTVMGALSAAQVLGVPAGLWLARAGGWRAPFFAVAALGAVTTAGATFALPPMRAHLAGRGARTRGTSHGHAHRDAPPVRERPPTLRELLARPTVQLSYLMTATVMIAGFLLVPNLAPYTLTNLRFPRQQLDMAYLVAGIASFSAMQVVGRAVDRWGSFRVGTLMTVCWIPLVYFGLTRWPSGPWVYALFVLFSITLSSRNVAYNTLTTKVPSLRERARFMSIQSTVQHAASSVGAIASSYLLYKRADGTIGGMERLVAGTIVFSALLPPLLRAVERRVVPADRSSRESSPTAAPPR